MNQYSQITNAQISNRLHDADGNLIDDGEKLFIWDAENRLIEIKLKSDNSTVATYAYDYQSRRITKTVGSTVTNFVYDGWNPIAEYTSALSPFSFTLSTSYTWGMDLSGSMQGAGGVGGLLSVNDGSDTYFPTFDGNGNVSEYVDATGNVVANYEYDAFGRVVASGTKANDFTHQFSTKQLDSESGLHYYGYRYYDSSNGRWPSRDPIEEKGGGNLYGFVENIPTNNSDYLGLTGTNCCQQLVARVKRMDLYKKLAFGTLVRLNSQWNIVNPQYGSCVEDVVCGNSAGIGEYNARTGIITLTNRADESVAREELAHARSLCRKASKSCKDAFREEVTAKIDAGICDGPGGFTKCSSEANRSVRLSSFCKKFIGSMSKQWFEARRTFSNRIPNLPQP